MEDTSSSPRKAFQVHDPAWYQELSQQDQIFARANRRAKRLGPGNPSPPWSIFRRVVSEEAKKYIFSCFRQSIGSDGIFVPLFPFWNAPYSQSSAQPGPDGSFPSGKSRGQTMDVFQAFNPRRQMGGPKHSERKGKPELRYFSACNLSRVSGRTDGYRLGFTAGV